MIRLDKMLKIDVVPLSDNYDEVTEDIVKLCRSGVMDSVAFIFSLHPEGNPVFDKVKFFAEKFTVYQEKLKKYGVSCGILLQSTMGHGWIPDSPAAFQRIIFHNGYEPYTFCPEDKDFQDYIYRSVAKAAALKPDFMMVDDDVRMLTLRSACFCPLHTELFNQKYGTAFTAEALSEEVSKNPESAEKMLSLVQQSILDFVTLIRTAIDSADPGIHCSYCSCYYEIALAPQIGKILAAGNGRPIVRINNSRYLNEITRDYPDWLYITASQIGAFSDEFDIICEPDTCPHNRYSVAAGMLRTHLALSMLEGCKGGKYWISKFTESKSCQAFRKVLTQSDAFLNGISKLKINWQGPVVPLPQKTACPYPELWRPRGWHETIGRMGIPFCFSKKHDNTVLLTEYQIKIHSDAELKKIFSGKVILDGSGIMELTRRGLAHLAGCEGLKWDLKHISIEKSDPEGDIVISGAAVHAKIVPICEHEELSTLYHREWAGAQELVKLAPGSISVTNKSGGKIIVISAFFAWKSDFSTNGMMCERRKKQLLRFLNMLEPLKIWYVDDSEIMLKYGMTDNGEKFVSVTNISLDVCERLALSGEWCHDLSQVEMLNDQGEWQYLPFKNNGDIAELECTLVPQFTTLLRLK